jgi:hypothetical protein
MDRIAKELKTLELCITYYNCILYSFMCILYSVCSNYNSRVVSSVRVLCSTVLRLWCLFESYSWYKFISEFYCNYAGRCRSCDPPKYHPEALAECLETILVNPENERPWASLAISVIMINDIRILRHYTMKIHRKCFYITLHSITHLHVPEILLRGNMTIVLLLVSSNWESILW